MQRTFNSSALRQLRIRFVCVASATKEELAVNSRQEMRSGGLTVDKNWAAGSERWQYDCTCN